MKNGKLEEGDRLNDVDDGSLHWLIDRGKVWLVSHTGLEPSNESVAQIQSQFESGYVWLCDSAGKRIEPNAEPDVFKEFPRPWRTADEYIVDAEEHIVTTASACRLIVAAVNAFAPGRAAEPETMKFGWVIERDESMGYAPEYFTGNNHPAMRWSDTGDHANAIRFARREDAERMAISLDGARKHRIAEHGWDESVPTHYTTTPPVAPASPPPPDLAGIKSKLVQIQGCIGEMKVGDNQWQANQLVSEIIVLINSGGKSPENESSITGQRSIKQLSAGVHHQMSAAIVSELRNVSLLQRGIASVLGTVAKNSLMKLAESIDQIVASLEEQIEAFKK